MVCCSENDSARILHCDYARIDVLSLGIADFISRSVYGINAESAT